MDYAPKRLRLGEMLVREGRLTPERLNELLRLQKTSDLSLGQIMVEQEILAPDELTRVLAEQLGIPHVWLRKGLIDPRIVHVLPKEKAQQFVVVPMFRVNDELTLATSDPHAIFVFDEVAKLTGLKVRPVLCRAEDIREAIDLGYREDVSIEDVMASVEEAGLDLIEMPAEGDVGELVELADGSPVINLTNSILIRAIRDGASDIHIEPQRGKFIVRVRIDSLLYELMSPKIEMHPAVVSRLKVMAKLDIAERRLPQDGRMQVRVDNRTVDLRFSSMPGILGEKVVLRVLDKEKAVLDLNRLGFDPDVLTRFKVMLKNSHGLVLACGPTGSGKTTSLYSALSLLRSPEKNIVTIEDPVEFEFEGINQNQVKEAIGLTFATFIRHALRQDPDIIMVGEIRDRETAETAIQGALTGHLVLSTLHTNDSPSTITRLIEMGVEPYLISSALLASLAQRLVRRVCDECMTTTVASEAELLELGREPGEQIRLSRGTGCPACYDSGFRGRVGIYELLEMSDGLQSLILTRPTVDVLRAHLNKAATRTLKDSGYAKVLDGLTTIEEVQRVTSIEGG